jgi:glycosyltransferase involved in cell wall biosynthesis
LTKWRIRSINKFVLLSKGDVSRALECGFDEQRMSFVYNFIDELQFSPYNNRSFVSLKQILVVGNLDNPDKQIDHVLKAFRLVNKEQRKDWKVKIIGDGRTKNSLINLSHELGISDYVQFSGKKADPIIDFFESDFYVLSSSFEGFPLTLLECVFSNLPIVSYPCAPSINEIVVNDVNGIVVKPNDIHSLSRAIQYLISNPDILAVMSQNQTSFKHKFNTNNILEKWEGLLFNKTTPIN